MGVFGMGGTSIAGNVGGLDNAQPRRDAADSRPAPSSAGEPALGVTPCGSYQILIGHYAIRISDQWRVVFKWEKGNATLVQVLDYH